MTTYGFGKNKGKREVYTKDEMDQKLETIEVITANTDLNEYITNGKYFFNNNNTPNNKPNGSTNAGYLFVVKRNDNDVIQEWHCYGNPKIFERQKISGTWNDWNRTCEKTFYNSGDVVSVDRWITGGYLTDDSKSLRFTVLLPKKISSASVSITGGSINVRSIEGQILQDSQITTIGELDAWVSDENVLVVYCTAPTAFNVTNNTPITVDVQNLTLSFA